MRDCARLVRGFLKHWHPAIAVLLPGHINCLFSRVGVRQVEKVLHSSKQPAVRRGINQKIVNAKKAGLKTGLANLNRGLRTSGAGAADQPGVDAWNRLAQRPSDWFTVLKLVVQRVGPGCLTWTMIALASVTAGCYRNRRYILLGNATELQLRASKNHCSREIGIHDE